MDGITLVKLTKINASDTLHKLYYLLQMTILLKKRQIMKFPVKIRILKNIDTSQLNLPLTQHSIV